MAGALVDHHPRQPMLIMVDIIRALLVGTLLFVLCDDILNVWVISSIIACLSTAAIFR